MSEYIVKLPNGGAADECIRLRGYEKSLYGYELHEEIVRCRDCKHKGVITDCAGISQMLCKRKEQVAFVIEPDGFCAWGGRW